MPPAVKGMHKTARAALTRGGRQALVRLPLISVPGSLLFRRAIDLVRRVQIDQKYRQPRDRVWPRTSRDRGYYSRDNYSCISQNIVARRQEGCTARARPGRVIYQRALVEVSDHVAGKLLDRSNVGQKVYGVFVRTVSQQACKGILIEHFVLPRGMAPNRRPLFHRRFREYAQALVRCGADGAGNTRSSILFVVRGHAAQGLAIAAWPYARSDCGRLSGGRCFLIVGKSCPGESVISEITISGSLNRTSVESAE